MKKLPIFLLLLTLLLSACAPAAPAQIAATTLPVWQFTARITEGTGLTVARLVTESVSCLHDYTLTVNQMKSIEGADVLVLSGAGLEDFLEDLLLDAPTIDASAGIELICAEEEGHDHEEGEEHHHEGHHHEEDPHIWLDPENAKVMAQNICDGLSRQYPGYAQVFQNNLSGLLADLDALQAYGKDTLGALNCRDLITFHDGFSYFARAFDLNIVKAVEEESGSEASAKELIELIEIVEEHRLPAIFTEVSGSTSAAGVIARETGCRSFALDMAMSGDSYFDTMYHNIDTIKETMG